MTACLLVVLLAPVALAVEVAGVRFPDQVKLGSTPLVLNGVGTRRATILAIKVYVAGLYVSKRTRDAGEVLKEDQPKYFVAVMKRGVSRQDSAPAFREGVERSAGAGAAVLREEIRAFERWIPSMRKGEQLTAAYTPGAGVVVRSTAKQDSFRGSLRFGTALFGMWIGPRASDSALRSELLRGSTDP